MCMATEHNCFVNPYCSHVLSDNLYPIMTSLIMRHLYVTARNCYGDIMIGASLTTRYGTGITGS